MVHTDVTSPGGRQRASGSEARAPGEAAAPIADSPGFAVHVDLLSGRLTASGRLAAGTRHLLHDAVSTFLRTDLRSWTVDVTDVVVADHAGLRAIAGCYRRALVHERALTVRGASPALRHALIRLRLSGHLLATDGTPPERRIG